MDIWDGTPKDLDKILNGDKTDIPLDLHNSDFPDHYDAEFPNRFETDMSDETDERSELG